MRRPILAVLPPLALLLAGCGTTQIDSGKAEKFVKGAFAAPPKSVKCPSGVEAKAGRTITCTAVASDGRHYDVVLHIVDGKGRVQLGTRDFHPR